MANEDPRIYFAAERTLLAWIRTGIAVMGLGFVIARFGLFLELIPSAPTHGFSSRVSTYVGAALVVVGAVAIAAGTVEYRRYCDTLRPDDLPSPRPWRLPQTLAWLLVALGMVLVVVMLT